MTIEEKAKAYDEALKLAKDYHEDKNCFEYLKGVLENLFLELAEPEEERIRKAILEFVTIVADSKSNKMEWISWLEKQGEKKSIFDFNANNWYVSKVDGKIHNIYNSGVEPKFHEDEWIVNNATLNLCHILRVEHGQYICDDCSFPITKENEYHLWTIQDAKDGDVLASELCDSIILFRGIKDDNIDFYCDYDFSKIDIPGDRFSINDGQHYGDVEDSKDFHPATKEQRDTLLKAMTDAEYTFDFEKKELKKIEEEYNGEDYGIDSLFHAQRILEKTLGKVEGYQTDDGILSHKCAITAVKKLYEQKLKWGDDDNLMIDSIIDTIERLEGKGATSMRDWLESLKQRMEDW